MKTPNSLIKLATASLAQSFTVHNMVAVTRELLPDYNIFKRTGYRESMAVPQRDAANQIIIDIEKAALFNHFICLLIRVHSIGFHGRKYPISNLKEIIKKVQECGFIYDHENKIFVEDPAFHKTRNWGALLEGEEYPLTFLRLDIAGNSKLVREYPNNIIQATYKDLRKIVETAIDKRNGRVWNWEGDGGMGAFYFGNKNLSATLSAMEIINELFFYNLMHCRLKSPLMVRVAVHSGLCDYTQDAEELMKSEAIKKVIQIEAKYTESNSATLSNTVSTTLESALSSIFEPVKVDARTKYSRYKINLEK